MHDAHSFNAHYVLFLETSCSSGLDSSTLSTVCKLTLRVKLRLAAIESHPGSSRYAARCQLQLLVGRIAYRGGLTWETPTRAMEVIPDHCHAIAPATSSRTLPDTESLAFPTC
jgi:hypothetical protein